MTELFAGIDGGQSSTAAVIGDERGTILGRGVAGPADEVGEQSDSTRLRDALRNALEDARRNAALPAAVRFAAVVAGISGYEGRIYGAQPQLSSDRIVLRHDAPIAHAGAFGGGPGVIVIAGTGSVVYGVDERGRSSTLGGWGYLFGDEGSAFNIVRESLAEMMRASDYGHVERGSQEACDFFGVGSLRELARAVYAGEVARDTLASFAPEIFKFPRLWKFGRRGAESLVRLVVLVAASTRSPKVALLGGLFSDARFRDWTRRAILNSIPTAEVVEPRYEPAAGALLLAYRELGLHVPELTR